VREGNPVLDSTSRPSAPSALPPLHRVAKATAAAATPEELAGELTAVLRDAFGADQVHLFEVAQDRTGGEAVVRGPGLPYDMSLDGGPSGVARVVASRASLHVPDARSGVIRPDMVERFAVESALFVPLTQDDEVRRVAIIISQTRREFSAEEIAHAEVIATVAAAGFARLDAERRRTARAAHDGALVRAARALNMSLELREVLRTLAHEAALAVGADLTGVYLGNGRDGGVATAGHNVPDGWHGLQLAPGEGAAGKVLATGRTYATNDYQRDVTLPGHAVMGHFKTAIAVPMAWNDQLKGALSVGWTSMRRIEEEDRRTLEAIADLATVACHNAETYHHVQQAARTDALTGLLNHGAMQVRVREEIARARRDGTPLSFVIIDLDDFKRVNDMRGHQAGDELLRQVAGVLQTELRPYDQVARYGGDEFVLLLPGSDEADARIVAERVRDAVAGELVGACSLGVAQWHEPLEADSLLEHADRALLLAKRTGKGRVAVANADVERELAMLHAQQGSPAAVQALAAAIEERDNYTHEHSEEVVHLARGVAMILGLAADQVERIAHAALLHDVGKLAVPNEILHKRGPLTQAEWEVMADHPVAGERILLRIPDLAVIAPVVRHEHEHWDGSGYPDRLRGRLIPIGSRIILACDAYHAMITDRPYRAAMSPEQAIEELRARADAQFDPDVVDALLDLLGHERPDQPDRAEGVRMPAAPPPRDRRR
jgi:diguanylate cyclase (GGDEF)-like protein